MKDLVRKAALSELYAHAAQDFGEYDESTADEYEVHGYLEEQLIRAIKMKWWHHVEYPSTAVIREVLKELETEGLIEHRKGCTTDCWPDDDDDDESEGEPCEPVCETPCMHYVLRTAERFPWLDDLSIPGERLRIDCNGYTPRTTYEEQDAFLEDRETLPEYDSKRRCWLVEGSE